MTPERVRELMGWPADVPEALLDAHLGQAARALGALVPVSLRGGPDWADALAWEAARTAIPALHTFALAGAGKVGRLEGSVEWRFLGPPEARELQQHCRQMAEACLGRLLGTRPSAALGGFWAAI